MLPSSSKSAGKRARTLPEPSCMWAEGAAQSVKCLLYKNEVLSLVSRTHKQRQVWGHVPVETVPGWERQADTWSSLAIQPNLIGQPRASERHCLKITRQMVLEKQHSGLTYDLHMHTQTCTCTHMNICNCTHMYMHTHLHIHTHTM